MFLKSENYIAIPPGATIKEQLNDRGLTQKEFALRMELSKKHISKLINGQVSLTSEVAMKLEMVLGIKMRFWLNLENLYQEAKKKVEYENNLNQDKEILSKLPYNEMVTFNWIPKARNKTDKIINSRNFFEVVSLNLLTKEALIPLFCRQLSKTDKNFYLLMTLAQKAKIESRNIITSLINLELLKDNISKLRTMTRQDNFIVDLQQLLSKCGIALILLPSFKSSYTHGFTFLDNNKIIIGITNRGKDSDKFWFSLFHEFGHILNGHIWNKTQNDDNEKEADLFAEETLIPKADLKTFINNNNFQEQAIIEFAKQINIDPSIVVGRLQKERFLKYNQLNNLKKKYEFDFQ